VSLRQCSSNRKKAGASFGASAHRLIAKISVQSPMERHRWPMVNNQPGLCYLQFCGEFDGIRV
jgi:hypothetical protein